MDYDDKIANDQLTHYAYKDNLFSHLWCKLLYQAIKERKKIDQKLYLQQRRLLIQCRIESKFKHIQTNQSSWLDSTLEKY